jgi:hypothetical protein
VPGGGRLKEQTECSSQGALLTCSVGFTEGSWIPMGGTLERSRRIPCKIRFIIMRSLKKVPGFSLGEFHYLQRNLQGLVYMVTSLKIHVFQLIKKFKVGCGWRKKNNFFFHLFVDQRKQFEHHGIWKTNKIFYDSTTSSTLIIFVTKARTKIKSRMKWRVQIEAVNNMIWPCVVSLFLCSWQRLLFIYLLLGLDIYMDKDQVKQ